MIPIFTDVEAKEQRQQLQEYFESLGVEKSKIQDDGGFKFVGQLVQNFHLCFKEEKDSDIESVLNSIVALLMQIPPTDPVCGPYLNAFCDSLVELSNTKNAAFCLRVLQNLNEGIGDTPSLSYCVFTAMIKIAGKNGLIEQVYESIDQVKSLYHVKNVGLEKVQHLFRLLHDVLNKNNSKDAPKVMIELLSTYTEKDASQARSDASRCIVTSLADPNSFLMDHLLVLKPVKYLEGQQIHDLLTIFVSEKLSGYLSYYNKNKNFIEELGLSHEQNMQKMRLLTFMQMAESKKELTFQNIQDELQLKPETVEGFLIDVLKTKLVKAKVDQVGKKVLVTSTMHRTFGKQQWQQLRDTLSQWQVNLANVHGAIANASGPQLEGLNAMS
ncbi:eukaryotic translation initiation factor 3 subunit m [Brevipalpus obovatus]|uniref:eukaryotic translation initiation factor 3 subunit m n=1 Tax=Brevipalpus obovatus TaxID=246614 RepID=UPI003D9EF0A2